MTDVDAIFYKVLVDVLYKIVNNKYIYIIVAYRTNYSRHDGIYLMHKKKYFENLSFFKNKGLKKCISCHIGVLKIVKNHEKIS